MIQPSVPVTQDPSVPYSSPTYVRRPYVRIQDSNQSSQSQSTLRRTSVVRAYVAFRRLEAHLPHSESTYRCTLAHNTTVLAVPIHYYYYQWYQAGTTLLYYQVHYYILSSNGLMQPFEYTSYPTERRPPFDCIQYRDRLYCVHTICYPPPNPQTSLTQPPRRCIAVERDLGFIISPEEIHYYREQRFIGADQRVTPYDLSETVYIPSPAALRGDTGDNVELPPVPPPTLRQRGYWIDLTLDRLAEDQEAGDPFLNQPNKIIVLNIPEHPESRDHISVSVQTLPPAYLPPQPPEASNEEDSGAARPEDLEPTPPPSSPDASTSDEDWEPTPGDEALQGLALPSVHPGEPVARLPSTRAQTGNHPGNPSRFRPGTPYNSNWI